MDYVFISLGILFVIGGILGCVIPGLPGPPASYVGLLFLHFTEKHQLSTMSLIIWAVVIVAISAMDYVMPAWSAKRFGGSKRAVWGSLAGLVIGIFFFPPFGIIIGPCLGAVAGELTAGKDPRAALRSGFGTFLGFMLSTLVKLIASGLIAWHFGRELLSG